MRTKGNTNDEEKVSIIIKYIEITLGSIEYEIDIDFNLILNDVREKNTRYFRIIWYTYWKQSKSKYNFSI